MKRFVTLLCIGLVYTGIVFAQADAGTQTLFIIKTKSLPTTNQLVSAIHATTPDTVVIREFDLEGKQELGSSIIRSIKAQISNPDDVTVLALGSPATQLAIDYLDNIRIIYTMADRNKLRSSQNGNIYEVSDKSSISDQIQILEKLLPTAKNIGIIADIQQSGWLKNEISLARNSSELGIHLRTIGSSREVPSLLWEFLPQIDAIIFVQDPKVINGNSYRYVVTTALENNLPTLVYSSYLVEAGFLGAYLPTPEETARKIMVLLGVVAAGEQAPVDGTEAKPSMLLILNQNTLQILGVKVPESLRNIIQIK